MTPKTRALITVVAIVLTLLALEDITTDTATTGFVPEWIALTMCAGWFVALGVQWARAR